MARVALGIWFAMLIVAILVGFSWYRQEAQLRQRDEQQLSEVNAQLSGLRAENQRLKSDLTKVQEEETRLAAINEMMKKAIEQARLTGKIPSKLPYPPK